MATRRLLRTFPIAPFELHRSALDFARAIHAARAAAPRDVGVVVAAHVAHAVHASAAHPSKLPPLVPITPAITARVWLGHGPTTPSAELMRRCQRDPPPRHLSKLVRKLVVDDGFVSAAMEAVLCDPDTTFDAHLAVAARGRRAALATLAARLNNRELHALLLTIAARGVAPAGLDRVVEARRCLGSVVAVACGALAGCRPEPTASVPAVGLQRPLSAAAVCTRAASVHRASAPAPPIDALGGNTALLGGATAEWLRADQTKSRKRRTGDAAPAALAGLGAALDLAIVPGRRAGRGHCVVCTACRAVRSPVAGLPAKRVRPGIVVDVVAGVELCGHCQTPSLVAFDLSCNLVVHRGVAISGCNTCGRAFAGVTCGHCGPPPVDRHASCFARCRTKEAVVPFIAKTHSGLATFYACPRHTHCIPTSVEHICAIAARYNIKV